MDIKQLMGDENEKPLDRLCNDGGFTGIFRTIACVGDSLSSGEFQVRCPRNGTYTYHDRYEHSWGQYLARMTGSTVYNFSRGGMTAKEYMFSYANEQGFWRRELAANAYILALGVNDILNKGWQVGSIDDVCLSDYTKNADSFAGYYAAIIQRYKQIQPEAKFFLVTMTSAHEKDAQIREHREVLYKLAEVFDNTYVIDLYKYAPAYDEDFRRQFFMHGHMNPMGYLITAKMICSYIDYIIRHNTKDFELVGMMGYDYER